MDSKQYYKSYQTFLKQLQDNRSVVSLEADDGLLLLPSKVAAHKNRFVIPYWTNFEKAHDYVTRAQHSYRLRKVSLNDFYQIALPKHDSERILVGINWDYDLFGYEVDTKLLLKDISNFDCITESSSGTLYLVKDNEQGVCNCRCSHSYISIPEKTDNPWDGSGWLFRCMNCGERFTFARAELFDVSLEQFALGDLINQQGGKTPNDAQVDLWMDYMKEFLSSVRPGSSYVYLDGFLLETELSGFYGNGLVKTHDLDFIPQVKAIEDPKVLENTFASKHYWK